MKKTFRFSLAIILILCAMQAFAIAQTVPMDQTPAPAANTPLAVTPQQAGNAVPPEVLILNQIETELKEKYKKEIYIPPSIQSLIFTPDQQSLLKEARSGFNTKMPTSGVGVDPNDPNQNLGQGLGEGGVNSDPSSAIRSVSLGGIVFLNPDEWTIWLNKRLVTSAKLPSQAIDLRVYKDFIELRWFDAQTNKIFPIRLRPNQTFNLDAQTFIPG